MTQANRFFWDKNFPLLRLKGPGTRLFLQGQTTADINSIKKDRFVLSCWLTATGRVRAILEIKLTDEGADVAVLAGDFESVRKGFDQVIFPADKLSLEASFTIRRLQIMSPNREEWEQEVAWVKINEPLPIGFNGFQKAKPYEVEMWRLKQGLPLGIGELGGENNPWELGLADAVSLDKGCYLGQETLAKVINSGVLKKQIRFWYSDSLVREGEKLSFVSRDQDLSHRAGFISSSMQNPDLESSFGLALINRQALEQKQLSLTNDSRKIFISLPTGFIPPAFGN